MNQHGRDKVLATIREYIVRNNYVEDQGKEEAKGKKVALVDHDPKRTKRQCEGRSASRLMVG